MNRNWGLVGAGLLLTTAVCVLAAEDQVRDTPTPTKTIRVDVDLVLATATVTTPDGRFVTGLDKGNFKIAEDKISQEIAYFSSEDAPLSVGIIFDVSGSMKDKMKTAVEAALTFMKSGSPDDEYFLVPFADKPQMPQEFTNDIAKIQSRFMFSQAKGRTALYDAVYLGLNMVEEGNNLKKALLLITDGEDNRSRYTFSNVKEYVKERDVQIYAIGIDSGYSDSGTDGRALLHDLAQITGGTAHFPRSIQQLEDICYKIALELKSQYVIGYESTNTARDGKWRKINVKVEEPGQNLRVRAKTGYYAPSQDAKTTKN
jgi:Ca-activated chloride channel family protein